MQVILLERIPKWGNLGDTVSVKPGFGRNYLIPRGKALAATPHNIALFEEQRAKIHAQAEARLAAAKARATTLRDLSVRLVVQAGAEGKLFGSITGLDIVEALAGLGHTIEKQEVRFVHGPIRHLGDYEVMLALLGDEVVVGLQVSVVSV